MFERIASAALVIAATTAAYAQTEVVQIPKNDPFALSSGSTFSASTSSKKKIAANASRTLAVSISTDVDEALAIIKQNYVDGRSANTDELAKSSINSMLKSLDPHSNYYDAVEYRELIGDQRSEYFGTGSTIISYTREGKLETYVVATHPGSASDRAGLRFADKITAVNGRSVEGKTSMEIRDLIRGPRNTSVRVTIERDGSPMIVDLYIDSQYFR